MHHAGVGGFLHAFCEDCFDVFIGVAGMDDQRELGLLRGLDVEAERGFLHLGRRGRVVVVEAGLADADEFGVAGEGDQGFHGDDRFLVRRASGGCRRRRTRPS